MEIKELLKQVEGKATLGEVAQLANLHVTHLYDLKNGLHQPTPATIARIRFAVSRIARRQTESDLETTILYRMSLALAALSLNLDPAQVQCSDPAAKKTVVKNWRDAAEARRIAQYVLNTGFGLKQADVARAAGVTKQAINQAVSEIENRRDDPAFDDLVSKVETWIIGAQE